MKKTFRVAALLFGLLVCALVSAQNNFDYTVSSVILLQSKPVQKEIGVTEQQLSAMNKFADSHRAKLKVYYLSLQKSKSKNKPSETRLLTMFNELKKGVLGQLNASQLKRLREISLQELGFSALGDAAVGTRIGLSSSQQRKVQAVLNTGITSANRVQMRAINDATGDLQTVKPKNATEQEKLRDEATRRAEAAAERVSPQVSSIRESTRHQIMTLLTPKQRLAWAELQGKPFHPSE